MDKKTLIIVLAVVLAIVLFFVWNSVASKDQTIIKSGEIILFYGDGCSHCKNVDDFIIQNKIEDKVKFTRMEVWYNKGNQVILGQIAKKCGINSNEVGVPFLYDGATACISGDIDVINFFKEKAGIQ